MQGLKSLHRVVALELAKGSKLQDICEAMELNYESWRNITRGDIFKAVENELRNEIEKQEIESFANDPVRQKIVKERLASVERLANERDNFAREDGASSPSRIKAATSILEMAGDFKKETEDKPQTVNVVIQQNVFNAIAATIPLAPQPKMIVDNEPLKEAVNA